MALVKCAECGNLISNKTFSCFYCGYAPTGICGNCEHFKQVRNETYGRCNATKDDYVRKEKSICPAVIKHTLFNL